MNSRYLEVEPVFAEDALGHLVGLTVVRVGVGFAAGAVEALKVVVVVVLVVDRVLVLQRHTRHQHRLQQRPSTLEIKSSAAAIHSPSRGCRR